VKNGADVNRLHLGTTSLHKASGFGNVSAVKALLALGADPLVRTGADVWGFWDRPGYNALDYAVWNGITSDREQGGMLVGMLIRDGAKVNQHDGTGKTPLHHAVANLHIDATTVLLKAGANVNAVDKKFVSKIEASEIVPPSYRHNIGGPQFGQTPLFTALRVDVSRYWDKKLREQMQAKRLAIVKLLLDKGADTAMQLPNGASPLHIAVLFANSEEIVELLLANGADIDATDNEQATPLHYAVVRKPATRSQKAIKPGLVRMFIRKGACLTARTKGKKMTPLDWAVATQRKHKQDLQTDTTKEVIRILKEALASQKQNE
jgi:ankyrin repeat protein